MVNLKVDIKIVINLSKSYYECTEEHMETKEPWMSTATLLITFSSSSWWASTAKTCDVMCHAKISLWTFWTFRCGNCKIPSLCQTTNNDERLWTPLVLDQRVGYTIIDHTCLHCGQWVNNACDQQTLKQ